MGCRHSLRQQHESPIKQQWNVEGQHQQFFNSQFRSVAPTGQQPSPVKLSPTIHNPSQHRVITPNSVGACLDALRTGIALGSNQEPKPLGPTSAILAVSPISDISHSSALTFPENATAEELERIPDLTHPQQDTPVHMNPHTIFPAANHQSCAVNIQNKNTPSSQSIPNVSIVSPAICRDD